MNCGPVVLQMIERQMFPSCEESAGENYVYRLRRRRKRMQIIHFVNLHFIRELNQYEGISMPLRGILNVQK